jgi:hypothetical protein
MWLLPANYLPKHGFKFIGGNMDEDRRFTLAPKPVREAEYRVNDWPCDDGEFQKVRDCLRGTDGMTALGVDEFRGDRQLIDVWTPRNDEDIVDLVDVLWLSSIEFVTTKRVSPLRETCELKVWLKGISSPLTHANASLCLYGYNVLGAPFGEDIGVGPELAPQFLSLLLRPMINEVSMIEINCPRSGSSESGCPMLSLVPTICSNLTEPIKVLVVYPSRDVLLALISFPFHPNVTLAFNFMHYIASAISDLHDCLRDAKYLRHLEVPAELLGFISTGIGFSANPAFETLTLSTDVPVDHSAELMDDVTGQRSDWWSSTMVQGIMYNENLKTLNIEFQTQETFEEVMEILHYLVQHCQTLPRFGIKRLCGQLDHLTRVQCIHKWCSHFLPGLVITRIRQQVHKDTASSGLLHGRFAGLVVRHINSGAAIGNATSFVPFDHATSNASALFHVVHGMVNHEDDPMSLTEVL